MFDFDVRGMSEVDPEGERPPEIVTPSAIALDTPVGEVPRGPAVALAPEATLATAIETMRRRGRGAVVVVRQHRPVGMVTDRDILAHVYAHIEDLTHTSLATVMVPCSPLRECDTVGTALRRMCALSRWHLPLVCGRGLVLGSIDFTDLALWLRDQLTMISVDAVFAPSAPGRS